MPCVGACRQCLVERTKLTETEKQLSSTLYQHGVDDKGFAAAITDFNVRKSHLDGTQKIGDEHVKNNLDVRGVLAKSNIKPENLPPEEDIQKLERRVKTLDKKQLKSEQDLAKLE